VMSILKITFEDTIPEFISCECLSFQAVGGWETIIRESPIFAWISVHGARQP